MKFYDENGGWISNLPYEELDNGVEHKLWWNECFHVLELLELIDIILKH
jgi:hypothetical protein